MIYCAQYTHIEVILSAAFPAMWHSVSIIQQGTDLVLEDMEEDKEAKKEKREAKEESQNQENQENLQPQQEEVSLTRTSFPNSEVTGSPPDANLKWKP